MPTTSWEYMSGTQMRDLMPSLAAAGLVKNDLFVESRITVMDFDLRMPAVSPPRVTFHARSAMKCFENPRCAWMRIVAVFGVYRAMLPAMVFVISMAFFSTIERALSR